MNAARRKNIEQAIELLEQASAILLTAGGEESDYFENMPEAIQAGEKGDAADSAQSLLSDAVNSVEEAINNAREAAT